MKLPLNAMIYEYEVDADPSYYFAGTKGIKKIYACVQINEETYKSLKENKYFNEVDNFENKEIYVENYMMKKRNYESFNIEDFEEISIKYYMTSIGQHEFHGIWTRYNSGHSIGIFIVLTKVKDYEYDAEIYYTYRLYVFNEG